MEAVQDSTQTSGPHHIGEMNNEKPDLLTTAFPTPASNEDGNLVDKASENPNIVDDSDDNLPHEYPNAPQLAVIVIGLCLAVFLVALDNTIIATAIPKISDDFQALNDIGWYGSAYLLTTCSFQLLFGKFYTYFSIKLVFLLAISVFELGSLVCGVAPSSTALIVGRAVAGLGAAGIFSGSLIIVAYNVPLEKRPVYSSIIVGMFGIASVAGPLMGGAFTDHLTWRWCFYINLPIGGATMFLITLFLKAPPRQKRMSGSALARIEQFDPLGTIFFIPAIICLLLALQWGGSTYAWSSGRIIALFVLFGIFLLTFIAIQIWKADNATVPPRVITNRSVAAGAWYGFWLGGAFFVLVYYMPIWFQAIENVSATNSGVRILPLILGHMLAVIISGALTAQIGYYTPFMLLGTVLMAIGAGLLTTLVPDSSTGKWVGYQLLVGLGIGAGFQQPVLAAQTVLPAADIPTGVAIMMFLQLLGGALFVSVAQNVLNTRLIANLIASLPGLDPQLVIHTGATQLRDLVPADQVGVLLEAYNGALTRTFMVSLILGCLTVVGAVTMEWRSVKGVKLDMAVR